MSFFSIILTDSVFAIDKNYYPKVFFRRIQRPCPRKKISDYEFITSSDEPDEEASGTE